MRGTGIVRWHGHVVARVRYEVAWVPHRRRFPDGTILQDPPDLEITLRPLQGEQGWATHEDGLVLHLLDHQQRVGVLADGWLPDRRLRMRALDPLCSIRPELAEAS
jgi:hypothetical protein